MRKLLFALSLLALGAPAYADTIADLRARGLNGVVSIDANGNVVTSTSNVGAALTDHTITSATGSSQQVMAANTSWHSLTIVNTGNANCGINPTGGTASIGGAGTLTLAPLGSYTPRVPTTSAVTAICTTGQSLYADEN